MVLAPPALAGSNLLDNSPFLPPSNAPGAAQESLPLELRSILKAGTAYEFSLYDTAKKQSTWARLNETGHDFVVKAFDPANDTVTVEQRSRTYKLALKEAKIALLNIPVAVSPGGAGGAPGAGAAGGVPQVGTGPQFQLPAGGRGPAGPIPTLTPEQLRNLEADINRRRELRRQATVSPAPLSTAQPAPGQPSRSR